MDEISIVIEKKVVKPSWLDGIRSRSFFLTQLSDKPVVQMTAIVFLSLMFMFCFLYHNIYSVIIVYRMTHRDVDIWSMLARFLTCGSIAISMNTSVFKFKYVTSMNKEFYRHMEMFKRKNIEVLNFPHATKFILYGSLYTVFCVMIVTAVIFRAPYAPDRDVWVQMACSIDLCDFGTLSEFKKNAFYSLDLFYYSLGTVSATVFINMIYSYSCLAIMSLSETYSDHFQQVLMKDDVVNLNREVILKHRVFCQEQKKLLTYVNEIFAPILVFFYGASLLCSCHFLTQAYEAVNRVTFLQICIYFVIYGQSFIGVFVISWVSSKIPEMFKKIFSEMQALTLKRDNVPLEVYAELNILLSQIQTEPVGVSIGGFFLITKNFYISYLGSIATIVIILIQFHSTSKNALI